MALFALNIVNMDMINAKMQFTLSSQWWLCIVLGASLLLCVFGCICMHMIVRRKNPARCVIQQSEFGDISISMQALKNMVIKCAQAHEAVHVINVHLFRVRNAIVVEMKITIAGNTNIPNAVELLQTQVTDYIADCSGVHVKQVRVMVDNSAKDRLRIKDANQTTITASKETKKVEAVAEPAVILPAQEAKEVVTDIVSEVPDVQQEATSVATVQEVFEEVVQDVATEVAPITQETENVQDMVEEVTTIPETINEETIETTIEEEKPATKRNWWESDDDVVEVSPEDETTESSEESTKDEEETIADDAETAKTYADASTITEEA